MRHQSVLCLVFIGALTIHRGFAPAAALCKERQLYELCNCNRALLLAFIYERTGLLPSEMMHNWAQLSPANQTGQKTKSGIQKSSGVVL